MGWGLLSSLCKEWALLKPPPPFSSWVLSHNSPCCVEILTLKHPANLRFLLPYCAFITALIFITPQNHGDDSHMKRPSVHYPKKKKNLTKTLNTSQEIKFIVQERFSDFIAQITSWISVSSAASSNFLLCLSQNYCFLFLMFAQPIRQQLH